MSSTAVKVKNAYFEDQHPTRTDCRTELLAGLRLPQKKINPKYFYDTRGSELFEQITRQREYYLTRSEKEILNDNASEIAECCGRECVLIEPGSGSSKKIRLLLDTLQPIAYVPLDISAEYLYTSALQLGGEFPWLSIHAICADFSDQWQARVDIPPGRRVVFYPGSTIGNLEPEDARILLSELRTWIGNKGGILIGVDLQKSEQLLNAAYNDAGGVTAEFNLNILNSINNLIGTNFNRENFFHRAFYNQELKRIEMHLVSKRSHSVNVNGSSIAFYKGETLHTENSYKYSLESFTALNRAAGLTLQKSWFDHERLFSFHYLTVTED